MKGAGRRVAITGYGVVAPCGIGKKAFWDGLNGPGITDHNSIEIADWDPLPYFDNPKEARRADRVEQLALAAAAEAFEHSGRPTVEADRIGTIFATGVGGLRSTQDQIEVMLTKGERRVSPFLVPMMMPNAAGAAISMRYGFRGPNETITHGVRSIDTRHRVRGAIDLMGHVRRGGHRRHRVGRMPRRRRQLRQHDRALDVGIQSTVRR